MEFTGERFVPGQGGVGIAYEHLARYMFAQSLVASGMRVLDIGSGEGYGSFSLAEHASLVVGLDVSMDAVRHATTRYASKAKNHNLFFLQGTAFSLPLASNQFDLVVGFEVLEHMVEHIEMFNEVRRVLTPEGIFLVSTPNKLAYSDRPGVSNVFHLKELYFDEFRSLVESHFRGARYFAQKNLTGNLISPLVETESSAVRIRRIRFRADENSFGLTETGPVDQMYFIAACSDCIESVSGIDGEIVDDRDQRLVQEVAEDAEKRILTNKRQLRAATAIERTTVEMAVRSAMEHVGSLSMQRQKAADGARFARDDILTYDLIIPVFNSVTSLTICLDSLVANTDPRHLVHVIDDASTDPAVESMMRHYVVKHRHVRYYRLPANLGFPGAVNAGMATTTNDVVLINSDTEFPPNWLPRLDRCRRSHPSIHAISPLSNNATICSVPGANQKNPIPPGLTVTEMDRLVQQTTLRRYPRVPTTVGFCMLITRRAIDDVGPFDMVFGRGYGEEVDWCQRAWTRGYDSVICDDVFVFHRGEDSFSQLEDKHSLRKNNELLVRTRWPEYEQAVQAYCARNPLRYQQQKMFEMLRRKPKAAISVMHAIHAFGRPTGAELFTRQLIEGMEDRVSTTVFFPGNFSPYQDALVEVAKLGQSKGSFLKVQVNAAQFATNYSLRGIALSLRSQQAERLFTEVLAASGAQIVQFDHLANLGSFALPLIAKAAGAKVVIVLHDYFLLCPDWSLLHANGISCGEPRATFDNPRCIDCLARRIRSRGRVPAFDVADYLAKRTALCRAILMQADVVIAPSKSVHDQFSRAWGREVGDRIRIVPHGTVAYPYRPDYSPTPSLRIAFLGNATPWKGVVGFVEAARRMQASSIQFQILGNLPANSAIQIPDNVRLAGAYNPTELPQMLQGVDVVVINSIVNETYCFTLDESFRAGVPVIATAMGAIPERVKNMVTGLLIPPHDVAALVSAIKLLDEKPSLLADMRRNVSELHLRSLATTVSEYLRIYNHQLPSHTEDDLTRKTMLSTRTTSADLPVTIGEFVAGKELVLQLPLQPVVVSDGVSAHGKGNAEPINRYLRRADRVSAEEIKQKGDVNSNSDASDSLSRSFLNAIGVRPSEGRGILHILHDRGGGTERQVRSLVSVLPSHYHHLIAKAAGDLWRLEAWANGRCVANFAFRRLWDESWPDFVGGICTTFGVTLLHLHSVIDSRNGIFAALGTLEMSYGFTVHDVSFACPTIFFVGPDGRYCREPIDHGVCRSCLSAQTPFLHVSIDDWRLAHRKVLAGAAFVVAPSEWAAGALTRYYPGTTVTVIPHALPNSRATRASDNCTTAGNVRLPNDKLVSIAVVGAIGQAKGSRRLERLVELVRSTRAPLRVVLIGYSDVRDGPWLSPDSVFAVHGRYSPENLPALLDHYRVRLVVYLGAWPETFCFTLSEVWAAGRPVIVPPYGALAERVAKSNAGWLFTEAEFQSEKEMLSRIATLLAPSSSYEFLEVTRRVRDFSLPSTASMVERTVSCYEAATADRDRLPAMRPIELERLVEGTEDASGNNPNAAWVTYQKTLWTKLRLALNESLDKLPRRPLISVIVPTYNTKEHMLRQMIESVCNQWYSNWELCIADDGSSLAHVRQTLTEFASRDSRIRVSFSSENRGVSSASNRAIDMVRGSFVLLLDHDDALEPHALLRVAESLLAEDPDFLYSDEVLFSEDMCTVLHFSLRPSYSPELLRGHPYMVHLVGFRTELLRDIGGFDESLSISQDYDLILRVAEKATTITHIPEFLYRWRIHGESTGQQKMSDVMAVSIAVLKRHMGRRGIRGDVTEGLGFNLFCTRYQVGRDTKVAIVIPTKNHGALLKKCVRSLRASITDVSYQIVILDHESSEEEALQFFADQRRDYPNVSILKYAGPFNFSAMNNWAVTQMGTEYSHYLFCNNDVEAMHSGWLIRMLELCQQPDVGIVGAQLLYPDRKTIQHAGVCVGAFGIAENYGRGLPKADIATHIGFSELLRSNREVAAVTGACLLIRSEAFLEVGGFDERLAIGFGDVDLCLRVGKIGYRVIQCPHAELIHHESVTRGRSYEIDPHQEDTAFFGARWEAYLKSGDPYFHPNLNQNSVVWKPRYPIPLRRASGRRVYRRNSENGRNSWSTSF